MGLNTNIKQLINYVVDNDINNAKKIVRTIISKETAEKNKWYCKSIENKLDMQTNFLELPYQIKNILRMEDVSNFNENRYFLSEREKKLYESISIAKDINEKLREMKIRYINSTIVYGESGTGKTTFGKYVAYKLGLPFAYLNFSYCIDSKLGETSKNINNVFDYVSKRKCVLLLDEIDAIGIQRGKEDSTGEMSRVTIGLMQSLDLLNNDCVVIGATNRIDMIDKALLRRFSIQHEIKELEEAEVSSFISRILEDLKIEFDINNIYEYSKNQHRQSKIENDITKSIIKMIKNKEKFIL